LRQSALLALHQNPQHGTRWQERLAAMTKKRRRVYQLRVVGGQIMMQDDLERLHKNMLEQIADE